MTSDYATFDFIVSGKPVAALTCLRCAAAIILRESLDAVALHDSWHDRVPASAPPSSVKYRAYPHDTANGRSYMPEKG